MHLTAVTVTLAALCNTIWAAGAYSSFELVNSYTGLDFPLAVNTSTSDLQLVAAPRSANTLKWELDTTQSAGTYSLCTKWQAVPYCLDIINDGIDKIKPHLATPGFVSGQLWTFTKIDGYYKLSNQYSGSGYFLDVYSGNSHPAFMSQGDFSGQRWLLSISPDIVA